MKFDIGRQWNGIGEEMEVTDCMGHVVISVGPPGLGWVSQMTVDKAREVAQALLAAADVAQSSTPAPYLSPDVIYQALGD